MPYDQHSQDLHLSLSFFHSSKVRGSGILVLSSCWSCNPTRRKNNSKSSIKKKKKKKRFSQSNIHSPLKGTQDRLYRDDPCGTSLACRKVKACSEGPSIGSGGGRVHVKFSNSNFDIAPAAIRAARAVVHHRHHLFDDGLGINSLYWSSGSPELLNQVGGSGRPSCWRYPDRTGRGGAVNRCNVASYDRFSDVWS